MTRKERRDLAQRKRDEYKEMITECVNVALKRGANVKDAGVFADNFLTTKVREKPQDKSLILAAGWEWGRDFSERLKDKIPQTAS